MTWTIEYGDTAKKALDKLDRQTARRIVSYMGERILIQQSPRESGQSLKGSKLGNLWRYRVGDYRVICDIQDEVLIVLVIGVGHRREVYR